MNVDHILAELHGYRERLSQAIAAPEGRRRRGPGRRAKSPISSSGLAPTRRHMSAAARKRIGEAKRKWWAKQKRARR